ncbi:MAG: hypothetical protein KF876_15525, partial [Nitrospira sp.]|nr:hypothetical protein [Nitrospira sp.]
MEKLVLTARPAGQGQDLSDGRAHDSHYRREFIGVVSDPRIADEPTDPGSVKRTSWRGMFQQLTYPRLLLLEEFGHLPLSQEIIRLLFRPTPLRY